MDKFVAFLKTWWPTILPVAIGVWHEVGPQVHTWVAAHPKYSIWFAIAYSIVVHLKNSPLVNSQPKA